MQSLDDSLVEVVALRTVPEVKKRKKKKELSLRTIN